MNRSLCVPWSQPILHSKFQADQGYIVKICMNQSINLVFLRHDETHVCGRITSLRPTWAEQQDQISEKKPTNKNKTWCLPTGRLSIQSVLYVNDTRNLLDKEAQATKYLKNTNQLAKCPSSSLCFIVSGSWKSNLIKLDALLKKV